MFMKFGHIADCHLGGWREPALRNVNNRSFIAAIQTCIDEQVDFVIIAGDLFNTALPAMDCLKVCVKELMRLKERSIPVYVIAGSHDYSPSGKTILDVFEHAGLFVNVGRWSDVGGKKELLFTVDAKTGVKLTGIPGRMGGLDTEVYKDVLPVTEGGAKIFCFHCTIDELKPEEFAKVEGMSLSLLPSGFDYYAGGHVHITKKYMEKYNAVYPGPTFPNSFSEIEKLGCGSLVIVEDFVPRHVMLPLHPHIRITIDCTDKTPEQIRGVILEELSQDLSDAIVTVRLFGVVDGLITDIKLHDLLRTIDAYAVLRNTAGLRTREFEEVEVREQSAEAIEDALIKDFSGRSLLFSKEQEQKIIKELLRVFSFQKGDGEKVVDFERRIVGDADVILLS
jgi:DNA repair protein SbcD/Mre11